MLVHRGKRGDPVLEPVERVAVEPQPCRHDAVHGGAHDAGENELELGLAVEHADVVEFLREQDRELVGKLLGTQVVHDVEHTSVSACAEPRCAHRVPVPVSAVGSDATAHPHPGSTE